MLDIRTDYDTPILDGFLGNKRDGNSSSVEWLIFSSRGTIIFNRIRFTWLVGIMLDLIDLINAYCE